MATLTITGSDGTRQVLVRADTAADADYRQDRHYQGRLVQVTRRF